MTTAIKVINTSNNIEKVIALHEMMRGAYHFTSPGSASSRRFYEEKHSMVTEIETEDGTYTVSQKTDCTCKNVYYKMTITKEGFNTGLTLRWLRKLVA